MVEELPEKGSTFPMEANEYRALAVALNAFYGVAADIRSGPERFERVLSESFPIRDSSNELEAISGPAANSELRRLAALVLEYEALRVWFEFEGLKPQDLPGSRGSPDEYATTLSMLVAIMKVELQALGALNEAHLQKTAPYVRRLLGEGPVAREPKLHKTLHSDTTMAFYVARLGQLYLHFSADGKIIEIVKIGYDD